MTKTIKTHLWVLTTALFLSLIIVPRAEATFVELTPSVTPENNLYLAITYDGIRLAQEFGDQLNYTLAVSIDRTCSPLHRDSVVDRSVG